MVSDLTDLKSAQFWKKGRWGGKDVDHMATKSFCKYAGGALHTEIKKPFTASNHVGAVSDFFWAWSWSAASGYRPSTGDEKGLKAKKKWWAEMFQLSRLHLKGGQTKRGRPGCVVEENIFQRKCLQNLFRAILYWATMSEVQIWAQLWVKLGRKCIQWFTGWETGTLMTKCWKRYTNC